jgi:hypothetical protein
MRSLVPVADLHHDEVAECALGAGETWRTPLAGGKFLFFLSGTLALASASGSAVDPLETHSGIFRSGGPLLMAAWGCAAALVIAYGCRFLDSVIAYALCGGAKSVDLPDLDPRPAITSLARWVLCFFPGPAFLVSLAIRCLAARTEFGFLEGLALAALSAAAMICWMLGRLLLAARHDLECLSPFSILTATRALGWRAVLATLGVTAAGIVHVLLAASAVDLLHRTWLGGFVLLWFCWFSAWQCGTYSLWTLGIWYHRASRIARMPGGPP